MHGTGLTDPEYFEMAFEQKIYHRESELMDESIPMQAPRQWKFTLSILPSPVIKIRVSLASMS